MQRTGAARAVCGVGPGSFQETPEGPPSSLWTLQPSACLALTRREPRRARASGPPAAPGDGACTGGFGATERKARARSTKPAAWRGVRLSWGAGILNLGSSSFHLAHLSPGVSTSDRTSASALKLLMMGLSFASKTLPHIYTVIGQCSQ